MPINRRYNVETLLSACDYYVSRKKQRLTFEYILIKDVNDSDEQARALAKHAQRLKAKVNLIPYNTVHGSALVAAVANQQENISVDLYANMACRQPSAARKATISTRPAANLRLQTKREVAQ